ncbi:c-type cytochrome [Psychrobacter jeotgali]|uniref:c-type cytochrome n=1 Tax=Psychrobacter jeotgali TaxID=179010 RepID=UPI0019184741|nr:c-type cytochrome [Psychrobacter jeotgali]
MSNKQYNQETRSGNSVKRWLYAGLGALVLILIGTYLARMDAVARFLGTADEVGEAQQASEERQEARENFINTSEKLSADHSVSGLNIPTDSDGFFAPPSDSEIPDNEFGESIIRGREIFLNPGANATEFVGNSLACANCHLNAGQQANSAPMWAAAGMYPTYRGKNKMINTMEDRVNGCFTYSMNAPNSPSGGPPPKGHQVYKDLESYFHWLATGAPNRVDLPGSGYPALDEPEAGYDPVRGAKVFEARCAVCHGDEGEGRKDMNNRYVFPPLWGPNSYNWGAGMHRVNTAAGFIYANMPLGLPYSLSEQQAWDVAAYINSHERPADPRQPDEGLSIAEAAEKYHDHKGYYGHKVRGQVIGAGVDANQTNAPSSTGTIVPEQ